MNRMEFIRRLLVIIRNASLGKPASSLRRALLLLAQQMPATFAGLEVPK